MSKIDKLVMEKARKIIEEAPPNAKMRDKIKMINRKLRADKKLSKEIINSL